MALSDGMGSGERAFRESTMVVEMLEELLNAEFHGKNGSSDYEYSPRDRSGRSNVFHD